MALVLGYSRLARDLLAFPLDVIRPIRLYAVVILAPLWFGFGAGAQIGAVAIGVLLILTIHTADAVSFVSESHSRAYTATDASQVQAHGMVVIPAMLPHLIAGLRLAVATAWGLSVLTELTIASRGQVPGLTHLMLVSTYHLNMAPKLLIMFLYAGMAILSDYALRAVARRYRPLYVPLGLVGQQLPRS